jgi:hypothetical protein
MKNIKETISRIEFITEERAHYYQHQNPRFRRISSSEFELLLNELRDIYESLDIPEIKVEVSDGEEDTPELILEKIKILPENMGILRDCNTGEICFEQGEEAQEFLEEIEEKMKESLEKTSESLRILQEMR